LLSGEAAELDVAEERQLDGLGAEALLVEATSRCSYARAKLIAVSRLAGGWPRPPVKRLIFCCIVNSSQRANSTKKHRWYSSTVPV
jgi:hypothetical protein